ncbi:hypothetical protein ACIFOC_00827 [Leucobacter aridicollis]|uniref:hypothetical protein n=1 Tax=Leucobacter aridicollis TaxID=283878 RepID=UPI000EAF3FE2|nr:hypothetical protein U746_2244 [Mycolicibacterium mucogenicum 261Sha1.1M5]
MHADVYLGLVNDQAEGDASLAHALFRNWQPIANDRAVWLTEREVSQAVDVDGRSRPPGGGR